MDQPEVSPNSEQVSAHIPQPSAASDDPPTQSPTRSTIFKDAVAMYKMVALDELLKLSQASTGHECHIRLFAMPRKEYSHHKDSWPSVSLIKSARKSYFGTYPYNFHA